MAAFGDASGLQLNAAKSKALALGAWDTEASTIAFPYVPSTRILGVVFSPKSSQLPQLNWPVITAAASAVLRDNCSRSLCIEQRVRFVNTFAMSKLWYVAKVVPPLLRVVQGMRTAVGRFVWTGWLFRVPFPVLCSSLGSGGFGLHDPVLRCKALFYSRWKSIQAESPTTFSGAYLSSLEDTSTETVNSQRPCTYFVPYKEVKNVAPQDTNLMGNVLTRLVYSILLPLLLPGKPRIESVLPNTEWSTVWQNVQSRFLLQNARSLWFAAVHDIFASNDRLFRIGRLTTDKCCNCGRWDTILHRIVSCGHAADIWRWVKDTLQVALSLPPEFLHQDFPIRPDTKISDKKKHNTTIWLTGHVIMAILNEKQAPTLDSVINNTLKPIRSHVLTHSQKYIEKKYGTYLEALF